MYVKNNFAINRLSMNERRKNNKKIIKYLKSLINKKRIILAIIITIILAVLIQIIHNYAIAQNTDVLYVSNIEMLSVHHMNENEGAAAGFIKDYLLTSVRFFLALWDSIRNVFHQIGTFFGRIFSMGCHPENSLDNTMTSFIEGLWNSIRYLFWGSDTSLGTVFIKLVKIEKDGLISLSTNIINAVIDLINGAIEIVNHLFDTSVQRIPYFSY